VTASDASTLSVYISTPPENLRAVAAVGDGVEVKLDWEHAAELSAESTLTDRCREQGVSPERVASVHLPPGTNRRYGMSLAPGNVGTIVEFVRSAFGTGVSPRWLTVHSARCFELRDHLERLATVPNLAGYPIAVENTPDASQFHAPEALALFALLTERIDRLGDAYLLVDTAHVDQDRRVPGVADAEIDRALAGLDPETATRITDEVRTFLTESTAGCDDSIPPGDPWRPALTALSAVGGDRVRAVHLNDPVADGLPDVGHDATAGLRAVLGFCRTHDVAVVLEPGDASRSEIAEVVAWLREEIDSA
jgi:hypothetical protein